MDDEEEHAADTTVERERSGTGHRPFAEIRAEAERRRAGTETFADTLLGQWVARMSMGGARRTMYHLVETVKNDEPTVHCGRTFRSLPDTKLVFVPRPGWVDSCANCQ